MDALRPSLFDAGFEPMITAKSPEGGQGHPSGQRQQFLFWSHAGGSERLSGTASAELAAGEDANGKLVEEVYRAGTPDGRSVRRQYLKKANELPGKGPSRMPIRTGEGDRRR